MDNFAQMLSRCATTMLGGASIQAVLDHFVAEMLDVLEVDGAGAVVLSTVAAPEYVAASDATAMEFERLQSSLSQGPCIRAHDSATSVSIPDLALDKEFPEFTAAARDLGLSGVFAFPLRQGDVSLGALDLYRMSTGMLGEAQMLTAQTLADVLAAYVVDAQNRAALEALSSWDSADVEVLPAFDDERTFVANLVHEFGSHLASISGFTWLLENIPDDLSDRQRNFVSAIHRNSDNLRALSADLLTLFSLDPNAAPGSATHVEVDLRTVVASTRETLASAPTAPDLDVSFHVTSTPVLVRGDEKQLERMLSNLVSNAVKYTPPGGSVSCALRQQDGHAILEVSDTGIGIPAEDQGELFTRFFRASTAKQLGIPGTGLGLAIVKSVVHNHAGTVDVSSTLGAGTRVVVRLPVAGGHSPQT